MPDNREMDPNAVEKDAPLREELVAYLDGELSAEESRRIEQRAAAEPSARRMLQEFDRTWHLLDELESPATSEDFTRTTLEMVALAAADDLARAKAEAPRRRLRIALGSLAGLAVAAAVGFVAVVALVPDPSALLLKDLTMLERCDEYHEIEGVDFLRALSRIERFAKDAASSAPATITAGKETVSQARKRVEAMTAEQRDELSRNERFFQTLKPEEQQRIRALHAAIEGDPDRDKLVAVMDRYCRWFQEQLPFRRGELEGKPPQERIEEILKQLSAPRISGNEIRLDDKNRQALARWMDRYTSAHESESARIMFQGPRFGMGNPSPGTPRGPVAPGGPRPNPGGENPPPGSFRLTPELQHRAVRALLYRRWKSGDLATHPPISEGEMADLRASLTVDFRERLQNRPATEQAQIIAAWLRETASSEVDERLAEYLESLTAEERDRLMSLPSDEMYRKLDEMYRTQLVWPGKPGEAPRYFDQPRWGDDAWNHRTRSNPPRASGVFPRPNPGNRQRPERDTKTGA